MEISAFHLTPYQLPLLRPWVSTAGRIKERCGWLITLKTKSGVEGYGDCAPLPASGSESPASAEKWLQATLPRLPGSTPGISLRNLPEETTCPAARFSIESALLDLLARQHQVPLHRLLSPMAQAQVLTNASIGCLDQEVKNSAIQATERGFRLLKLKVGMGKAKDELAQLKNLIQQLPAGTQLRLDANRAWTSREAYLFIEGLVGLPIESLEEPLQEPNPSELEALQAAAPFDLAMDESLQQFIKSNPISRLPVKRLIAKPTLLGGMIPCMTLAKEATKAGVTTIVTSTLESAAGIWAAAQLAAAVDAINGQNIHGLATSSWFKKDLAQPPLISDGILHLGSSPGSGFIPGKSAG